MLTLCGLMLVLTLCWTTAGEIELNWSFRKIINELIWYRLFLNNFLRQPLHFVTAFFNQYIFRHFIPETTPEARASDAKLVRIEAQPEKEANMRGFRMLEALCDKNTGEVTSYDAKLYEFLDKAQAANPYVYEGSN